MNDIVERLVSAKLQLHWQASLGVRANFRCEYCGLEFLTCAENYRQWQWDHIEPRYRDGTDGFDNLACACRTCNWIKGRYNPRDRAGIAATRDDLIKAATAYIQQQKAKIEQDLKRWREIVQSPGSDQVSSAQGVVQASEPVPLPATDPNHGQCTQVEE
jgi:hypothetical protein